MSVDKSFFDSLDGEMEKQAKQDIADKDANDWNPENEGDTIKGIFLKVTYIDTKYGVSPLAIVRDLDSGESHKVWCSRKALRGQMEEAVPTPGTPIGIRYGGFVETPDGNYDGYHLYTVRTPERDADEMKKGYAYWHEARTNVNEVREQAELESDQAEFKPF